MRKTKIVCTLGPSTAGKDKLKALIEAGMDVARFNFSHGDKDSHTRMMTDLRAAEAECGKPIAILGDLCGPKIRVGKIRGGAVELTDGAQVRLTPKEIDGDQDKMSVSYPTLALDVQPGEPVLINDGLVRLTALGADGDELLCRVEVGGRVSDKKGVNFPGSRLTVPALTEKDKRDIVLARSLGVDYLALSFVRKPEDILETKKLAEGLPVIAKIEKPEAICTLDDILSAADGAMVARGDLGVELGHEKVPLVQKRIIAACQPLVKPVITATQMLESMIQNPTPTRAEVSDVANAVLDGTDAVMLSGETSAGKYPVEAVKVMASIIDEIEGSGFYQPKSKPVQGDQSFSACIAHAVSAASREHGLAAIAVYSESGRSAAIVSAERPKAGLIAFSRHESVLRRLSLLWGVRPLYGDWVHGVSGVVEQAERELLRHKLVRPGDHIAVTFGLVLFGEPFQTNVMKLWTVRG